MNLLQSRFASFTALALLGFGLITALVQTTFSYDGRRGPADERALRLNGSYKIMFAGPVTGAGRAVISAQRVKITGQVKDREGRQNEFRVDCELVSGRFKGSGDIDGGAMEIEGRADAPGADREVIRAARITATYKLPDGSHGRLAGARINGPED